VDAEAGGDLPGGAAFHCGYDGVLLDAYAQPAFDGAQRFRTAGLRFQHLTAMLPYDIAASWNAKSGAGAWILPHCGMMSIGESNIFRHPLAKPQRADRI
jgi:hypothetical protein